MNVEFDPASVTMAKNTIHNPADARHLMKLKPIPRRVQALFDGRLLAESTVATRVLEMGYDLYDPMIYFPKDSVVGALTVSDAKPTHCPLKGDATYFNLLGDDHTVLATKVAWSYEQTFDFASDLNGLIAFEPSLVTIIEAAA